MANTRYHNDSSTLNHLWYESHKNLLTSLCIEFDQTDQIDDMIEKFLCKPIKMKTLKDPNKPKRAKSAYLYYCEEHRNKVITKLRNNKTVPKGKIMVETSKKLGSMWQKLDEKAREPYTQKASVDKERYADEMEQYTV